MTCSLFASGSIDCAASLACPFVGFCKWQIWVGCQIILDWTLGFSRLVCFASLLLDFLVNGYEHLEAKVREGKMKGIYYGILKL